MPDNTTIITPDDQLLNLVGDNPQLLGVMSRFGLSFGFGDKTIREACAEDNVDLDSFLAVCSYYCHRSYNRFSISLPALMSYLRKAHTYFLDFLLPSIRRRLIEAINCSDINDVAFLLLKFFDDYVREVRLHMQHENDDVFAYVARLLAGDASGGFAISDYSSDHVSMTERLTELKDIFIRHYHVKDNEILTLALMDIIDCGDELERHCDIENRLFIPAVEKLERSIRRRSGVSDRSVGTDGGSVEEDHSSDTLIDKMTQREKDILRCVAKGMTNKEIACHLCISVHTVTTYRRNISSKLRIHSAAGLTIFAIIHNLIDIHEVNPHV